MSDGGSHGKARCGHYRCHGDLCGRRASNGEDIRSNRRSDPESQWPADISKKRPDLVLISDWIASPQGQGNKDKFCFKHNNKVFMAKIIPDELARERYAENELLCNKIAQAIGLMVPSFGLSKFNGNYCFTQEWMLRVGDKMTHMWRFVIDENGVVDLSVESINRAILKNSFTPENDSVQFAKMLVLDCLIGNDDRHGGNLAMIYDGQRVRLSPSYDNVSGILPHSENGMTVVFGGKIHLSDYLSPSTNDYITEVRRLWGRKAEAIFSVVRGKAGTIEGLIGSSGLRDDQKKRMLEQLKEVLREIGDA